MDHSIRERPVQSLRPDLRHLLLLSLFAVATVAALLWWGNGAETLGLLARADWRLLALGVLVHYGGFGLRARRWQLLLSGQGHRLGYLYTGGLLLAGWFFSALLPARAGDVFRVLALRLPSAAQPAVPAADGLGSIVAERALDILALLLLSAGFGILVLGGALPGWLVGVYVAALVILVTAVGGVAAMPGLLGYVRRPWAHPLWQRSLGFAEEAAQSLHRLVQRPMVALQAAGLSLLIWLCDGVLLWSAAAALGAPLPAVVAGFVALSADIFAALPLTPGSMGQIETAYAGLLRLVAQPDLPIPALVLLTRAVSYWSFLVVAGGITLVGVAGRWWRAPLHRR